MATNARDIEDLLARGEEQRGVEFKPAAPRSAKEVFAKVARAMMAMANKRDGGRVHGGRMNSGNTSLPTRIPESTSMWSPSSSKGGAWS